MSRLSAESRPEVVVLGLNYAPETTGIAPYTTGFARHLAAAGHDVTVIAGHPHYPEWAVHPGYAMGRPAEDDLGVRLVRVQHPVPADPTGRSRIWMEAAFAWSAGLRLLRLRPTVVVVISPALLSILPALVLRRLLGYRVGIVVQDLYGATLAETGLGGSLLARTTAHLETALLRRADGITVIHEVFRQVLLDGGVADDRIEVIPNWTHIVMPEDPRRQATRRELGWKDDDFIALHAGNMGVKQGLEGLVDVAHLAGQRRSRVRIVLLGDGSQRTALEQKGHGMAQLSFLGPLPDGLFERALGAADCLLLHEKPGVVTMSVPSKLTSYFAADRPVVAATDPRSGAAALMTAAAAGVTVEAGEPAAILDAIEQIAADDTAAAAYGRNSRRYAAEHLAMTSSLARTERWVRRLADWDHARSAAPASSSVRYQS
jgi:glycosyltransferase involved in cell wall biosynthesis